MTGIQKKMLQLTGLMGITKLYLSLIANSDTSEAAKLKGEEGNDVMCEFLEIRFRKERVA